MLQPDIVQTNHTTFLIESMAMTSPNQISLAGYHYSGPEGVFEQRLTLQIERSDNGHSLIISFPMANRMQSLALVRCSGPPDPNYVPEGGE
jgi:hypothetical protein